ncbi:MAG: transketolase family protein [Bacillota bacterium]|jgi:transketolase
MTQAIATREAYGRELARLGEARPDIVVLDADLSGSTKTSIFAQQFPDRFFNMGIAESDMMGTAAGLATTGLVPFASTFAIFATGRAFEQIRNSIAYPQLPVVIAATHAGVTVGPDGGSHQSVEDIALMRSLPGMTLLVPADGVEAAQMVHAAAERGGPVYLRLGRSAVPILPRPADYRYRLGQAELMADGDDVAIFACGIMVQQALEARETLQEQNISAAVINVSTIKPIDVKAIVEAARHTGCAVTAEEHSIIGGLGSAVAEVLAEHYPVPMERVGVNDAFGESGPPAALLEKYGLTAAHIVEKAVRAWRRKRS